MDPGAYREFREQEDRHWWFLGRKAIFAHAIRFQLRPPGRRAGSRALDLGCGMGAMLPALAAVVETVIGADIEQEALQHCRDRGHSTLFRGLGQALPLPSRSVDLITAFDTIEHIPEEAKTLAECHRVLRPGGYLFVSVPAYQWLYSHQDRLVHHQRRYTAGDLARRLTSAGFRVQRVSYINALLFPLILPAVLLIKLKQRIWPPAPDAYASNVGVPIPQLINRLLLGIFSFERHLVIGCSVPVGHSLIAVARKP